ncbi:heme ABC exporter ATP-binding protein CcmA [Acuticoccus sp. MNP-M23]|uniref:heme ABC exporter ATP-binding protein CcmA n=1 Tax=Acuticoccus sp. MNP-M23 TaxID=3072793 RepID=UPI002814F76D|nr:heme ABC exporter ATP-binding protein CcmA [Acuticoccus sp. MNP-M23]WMS41082.1 heme ABC exporter ATP-binding protein CcmA [Acuticoccus sp. MNP-M23]
MNSFGKTRLEGRDVSVTRGGRLVLTSVSFTIAAGDALIVAGPNGAGKSTLLRAVAGLCALDGGAITLEGAALPADAHLIGHQNALKPQQTVLANLIFWADWQGGPDNAEARAEAALDAVGLLPLGETPAQFLSQGQRRRLALARLLASPRPLWLLDEPVAGLDAAARTRFAAAMADHRAEGGLVMASTHEPLGLEGARTLDLS